ncbi:MAG: divergent PAP2 family protein [Veillonella sp.]|nr:divergent PAP2 family protein [Veillonella sp.]
MRSLYLVFSILPVAITRKEALKELLGHTPIEVFGGLILGILVACIQFYYIYNGVI